MQCMKLDWQQALVCVVFIDTVLVVGGDGGIVGVGGGGVSFAVIELLLLLLWLSLSLLLLS